MPLSFAVADAGILPDRMIAALAEAGAILPVYPFTPDQVQPASLDLRLGDIAYRVRASFLPGPKASVAERVHHAAASAAFPGSTIAENFPAPGARH